MGTMRLHWRPGTAAMAPHAALAEIGVDYELVLVERDESGQSSPEYLALNPSGRVPTLEDGDLVLTESAAILLHLADRFPAARLAPPPRAELYRWLIFMTNTVQAALMRVIYPERYGDDGVREAAAAELRQEFARLEGRLDGRDWLAGEERTAADLFLFMLTRWGRRLEPPVWDSPNLRAHFLRTLSLPGVRRMVEEQGLELPVWSFEPPRASEASRPGVARPPSG
jgi:glutathione S-transferase